MGDPDAQPGGLNRYVAALAAALGEQARTVTVSPADPLPVRLIDSARRARRLATDSDVVHVHFALYAWWPVVVGSLRRHPLVVHVHGSWAAESSPGPAWVPAVKRRLERAVYRRANRVVVLSPAVRSLVEDRYAVDPNRVVELAPGVDREVFSHGPDERAALGVPTDQPLVLTVRRLVARTGVDVLLTAMEQVPGAHLAVVGDGPERPRLEQQAVRARLVDRVTFAGRVPDADLPRWYRSAAVSVVPSLAHEGWGLVVDESLACGTPVVASRQGGLSTALVAAPGGLVPPGDPTALASRLRGALDGSAPLPSPEQCRAATDGRDWSAVAVATRQVYEQVTRPRVVVIGHCARPSGAELALLALAPELAREVELTVVLGEDGPVADRLRAAGVPVDVLALAGSPAGLPGYVLRLAALLRRRRTGLVHVWTLRAGSYALPAARLAGLPVVWSARDRLAPGAQPHVVSVLARRLADRHTAAVVANSAATLVTWRPRRARSAVVASPGVVRGPVERTTGTPFTVGCLSRLSPWKGQDLLLRAFAQAFPTGPQRLRLVGGVWFGEHSWPGVLHGLADELGVADRVDVVGHRDDVAAELALVDVVVAYSALPEPFGQVVVDTMTAGRPVIVAGEGGPAETVTDGVDGLHVPPRDPHFLSEALRRLHDDPALRARLTAGGSRTAGRYRPHALATELLAVYREVLR